MSVISHASYAVQSALAFSLRVFSPLPLHGVRALSVAQPRSPSRRIVEIQHDKATFCAVRQKGNESHAGNIRTCQATADHDHATTLQRIFSVRRKTVIGYWLTFYVPLNTKWLGMEKQNLTQQKQAFANQKRCTIQHKIKHEKTEARFSRLPRLPAWKLSGPILVSALHKFVTYLLT